MRKEQVKREKRRKAAQKPNLHGRINMLKYAIWNNIDKLSTNDSEKENV
jgi:hypothetical protein